MHRLHYIDLFCGAGGVTTGVESAMINDQKCADVLACVNHDPNAIASHLKNHKGALHILEDIWLADTAPIVELVKKTRREHPGDKIVLWASCECTNYSRAKGGKPRDPDSRTLPESLFRYIEAIRPDYIELENVTEFLAWGPMDENNHPISSVAGSQYVKWVNTVKSYGYEYDYRILNSADYGAYTSRKRYFGLFHRPGLPSVFPEQTHVKRSSNTLFDDLLPWKAVRDVLDLEDEGESIFTRKKPLVDATIRRITAGVKKFAGKDENFLVKHFSGDDASKCISIDGPAGTVTCKDHHGIVKVVRGEQFLDNQYGHGQPTSLASPCGTVMVNPKQSLVTVKRWLMVSGYAWPSYPLDRPCPTIVASQEKSPIYIVNAMTGAPVNEKPEDSAPMRELKRFCRENSIADIRMRMLNIRELKRIMGFPEDYVLVGTLGDQKKFIGNAVECGMARQLCESISSRLNSLPA